MSEPNRTTVDALDEFARKLFNVDAATLLEAIRLSPNAQGYISGAVSELEVRRYLESKGYELLRIMEKWKGEKLLRHHGDFYVRKKGSENWYVLETKGVKSNSEEWHQLNERDSLEKFLRKWNKESKIFKSDEELVSWCNNNFQSDLSKRRVRVLETHFVAGESKQRKINTSRNDEFDYVAVDLFLRTGRRQFIFARPTDLSPSKSYSFHLQQNYIIDVLLDGVKEELSIKAPWHWDFKEIFDDSKQPVQKEDMQIDDRN